MGENKGMLDIQVIEEIVRLSFSIKDGETPEEIVVSYNDMINYTKFVMENVLNSAMDCTTEILEEEKKNNNRLNMN